jgi:hypothetical protein
VVGCLVVNSAGLMGRGSNRRSLTTELPQLVDSRPICFGPRRRRKIGDNELREPFSKRAVYALHLGSAGKYGRFNNQIIELANAVDVALDSGGHTIVVVSDWMVQAMMPFFPNDDSWERLEQDFPIIRNATGLELQPITEMTTELILSRGIKLFEEQSSWDVIQARRLRLLHYMFSNLEGEPCHFMHENQGYLHGKFNQTKYVAIHVRNMEGMCIQFNSNYGHSHEQCSMSPSYINSVMDDNDISDRKLPLYLLSDMQDEEKLHKLHDELDRVVIPIWDFGASPSMIADMVVGAMSEFFIGEQGSSASRNIGILREAFGKNVSTNYVFMDKREDGKWTSYHPHHPYVWAVGKANQ